MDRTARTIYLRDPMIFEEGNRIGDFKLEEKFNITSIAGHDNEWSGGERGWIIDFPDPNRGSVFIPHSNIAGINIGPCHCEKCGDEKAREAGLRGSSE